MANLPQQCNYLPLASARIREIKSIVAKLENCEHGGRVFQKLPRHMQRRAVSSNPRRLPRYLREKHLREVGSSTKPTHRPRRKFRRRPSNLLQEYNRRQREHVWLETHVWHAKRFHVHRHWGYALPYTPTCRGHRSSLRAATTGCLLQDVSFLCCVELKGTKRNLLTGLSSLMLPDDTCAITDPQVMAGRRWVSCVLFHPGRQPYGALAEVDILFHPKQCNTDEKEQDRVRLWLWVHPSAHLHVLQALTDTFHLQKQSPSGSSRVAELSGGSCVEGGKEEVGNGQEKMEVEGLCERIKDFESQEINSVRNVLESEGESRKELSNDSESESKGEIAIKDGLEKKSKDVLGRTELKGDGDVVTEGGGTEENVLKETQSVVRRDFKGEEWKADLEIEDGLEKQSEAETKEDSKPREFLKEASIEHTSEKKNKPSEQEQNTRKGKRTNKSKKPKNVNAEKLKTRNVPFDRTPKYISADGDTILTLLKDTLNRFRLLGPRSYSVLSSAIHPAKVVLTEEEKKEEEKKGCEELKDHWWREYYESKERIQAHKQQVESWESLACSSHPPGKAVLPLVVRDPRVTLPSKKVPMKELDTDAKKPNDLIDWSLCSPIFSSDLRDRVTLSKEPDAVINQRRSQYLIPGSPLPHTPQETRLPLLLLSRPSTHANLGSGWDVVAPAGWGMSLFLPLTFNGGAVYGQREAENLHFEAHTPLPPYLLPDTTAGALHTSHQHLQRREEFFKRPPASRLNHIKLGVQFPFSQPWRKLVTEWQPGVTDFFVLRDSRLVACLQETIESLEACGRKGDGNVESSNISGVGKNTREKTRESFYTTSTQSMKTKPQHPTTNGNSNTTTAAINIQGKRKSGDGKISQNKKAKHEHWKEEDMDVEETTDAAEQLDRIETHDVKETDRTQANRIIVTDGKRKTDVIETEKTKETEAAQELDTAKELFQVSGSCLVGVEVVLAQKGTLEACAMVCVPREEDLCPGEGVSRPGETGEALQEPQHHDHNHQRRRSLKEEHTKIMGRMRRLRRRAKQQVAQERDFESSALSSLNLKEAVAEALKKVDKENETILKKYASYKETMEDAWLMSPDEPLQCCARPIMGYTTHGDFSYTRGKGAGVGWVALKPLLRLLQQYRESAKLGSVWETCREKSIKRIPVLVRNPSSLIYRWAYLSVIERKPNVGV